MSAKIWNKRGDGPREHHYAFEAASLVLKGRDHLQGVIECDHHHHPNLLDLDQSLRSVEQYLHGYILQLIEQEMDLLNHETLQYPGNSTDATYSVRKTRRIIRTTSGQRCSKSLQATTAPWSSSGMQKEPDSALTCLQNAVRELRRVTILKEKYQQRSSVKNGSKPKLFEDSMTGAVGTRRTSEDYLLFRLIVILQLCLVRIQEADTILCRKVMEGKKTDEIKYLQENAHLNDCNRCVLLGDENLYHMTRPDVIEDDSFKEDASDSVQRRSSQNSEEEDVQGGSEKTIVRNQRNGYTWAYLGLSFLSSTYLISVRRGGYLSPPHSCLMSLVSNTRHSHRTNDSLDSSVNHMGPMWLIRFARSSLFLSTTLLVRRGWRVLCMNARLENTVTLVEDWCAQWNLIESIGSCGGKIIGDNTAAHEKQCRQILQLIPVQSTQSSVWQQFSLSDAGAIRFSLIVSHR